jgi:hypothetical protein
MCGSWGEGGTEGCEVPFFFMSKTETKHHISHGYCDNLMSSYMG